MKSKSDGISYTPTRFGELIYLLKKNNKKYLNDRLSDYNLTLVQGICLLAIDENENITQKELADLLNITKSGITKSVNNLQKDSFIIKERSQDDARQFVLRLTEKGEKIIPLLYEIKSEWENKLGLDELGDEFMDSLKILAYKSIALNSQTDDEK